MTGPSTGPPTGSVLDIGVVLPDLLGTYSDSGNATVLAQRARWRGLDARVLRLTADTTPPTSCAVYLLGGGEDSAQLGAARWLAEHPGLCRALAGPGVTLAVCAGLQLLGTGMTDRYGRTEAGLGLIDVTTTAGHRRAVGEVSGTCTVPGVGLLTGFENHLGRTTLGPGLTPLARLDHGVGNGDHARTGDDAGDGVVVGRIVGTYLHGPVLARNPALADHLLTLATGRSLPPLEVPDQHAMRHTYLR